MFESTVKKPGRNLNMGRDSSWLIGADIGGYEGVMGVNTIQ